MDKNINMEAFFTREKANEGVEVPLYLPSGEKSNHWIRIRGVDSDHFRLAEADSRRQAMNIATIDDTLERAKAIADAKLALIAELVISWSFEQECTLENVKDFFRQAPQIADAVDQVASKRALFFGRGSSSSQSSLSQSSDSTKNQKDQSKPSEQA
jgi:hypothetical protein